MERQIVDAEATAPGFGEGGLNQHQHGKKNRKRTDQERITEHDPAPGPQRDHPPFATLAGDGGVAPAAQYPALQPEHQDGNGKQRHRVGRGFLDPDRIFEKLPELRRYHVETGGQCDQRRRAEQCDGFEETYDDAADDRRRHQRQRNPQRGAQRAGAEDIRRIFHFRRHQIERRTGEHEGVGKRRHGDHQDQARHRIDIEDAVSGAGQCHPDLVEPAGIRAGQKNPADRTEIGRRHKGGEHHQPNERLGRHIGTGDRPRDRDAEAGGKQGDPDAKFQRVGQRLEMSDIAIGSPVIGERKASGIGLLQARNDQPQNRIQHQEDEQGDQRQPQQDAGVETLQS